jgi:hypothetical protein
MAGLRMQLGGGQGAVMIDVGLVEQLLDQSKVFGFGESPVVIGICGLESGPERL